MEPDEWLARYLSIWIYQHIFVFHIKYSWGLNLSWIVRIRVLTLNTVDYYCLYRLSSCLYDKNLVMGIEKGALNEIWHAYKIDELSQPFLALSNNVPLLSVNNLRLLPTFLKIHPKFQIINITCSINKNVVKFPWNKMKHKMVQTNALHHTYMIMANLSNCKPFPKLINICVVLCFLFQG